MDCVLLLLFLLWCDAVSVYEVGSRNRLTDYSTTTYIQKKKRRCSGLLFVPHRMQVLAVVLSDRSEKMMGIRNE